MKIKLFNSTCKTRIELQFYLNSTKLRFFPISTHTTQKAMKFWSGIRQYLEKMCVTCQNYAG